MAIESPVVLSTLAFTGEDKGYGFTIFEEGSTTERQDMTGWSLSWMVKRHKRDLDVQALITKTTADGITLTNAAEGECLVALSKADIQQIKGGQPYYHELKRIDDGFEAVLSFGSYMLNQAVHRA